MSIKKTEKVIFGNYLIQLDKIDGEWLYKVLEISNKTLVIDGHKSKIKSIDFFNCLDLAFESIRIFILSAKQILL